MTAPPVLMSEVRRYRHKYLNACCGHMEPHSEGDYVLRTDHDAVVAALTARLAADAAPMRAYYFTAYAKGFANCPLWHELAEETRQTYREHVARAAAPEVPRE